MSLRSSCSIHLARTAVGTSAASGGSPPLRPALWGAPFGASLPPLPADLPTTRAPPEVSEDQKIRALRLISTPSSAHHKGSSGRIVVIGGSRLLERLLGRPLLCGNGGAAGRRGYGDDCDDACRRAIAEGNVPRFDRERNYPAAAIRPLQVSSRAL